MGVPVTAGSIQPVIDGNSQVNLNLDSNGQASGTYVERGSGDEVQINYQGVAGEFNPSTATLQVPAAPPPPAQNTQVVITTVPSSPTAGQTVTWTATVTTTP